MSLEVQSCNFWEDGRFFPLWTSKDIKTTDQNQNYISGVITYNYQHSFFYKPMSASNISEHFIYKRKELKLNEQVTTTY